MPVKGTDGPLDGTVKFDCVQSGTLPSVPEEKPLQNTSGWCEVVITWTASVALLLFIIFGANDVELVNIMPKVTVPDPPQSVPFSAIGFLRKAFFLGN